MADTSVTKRGDLVLMALRFVLIASAISLVGVLGHVAWKVVSA
jgi:hypothetical protein